MWVHIAHVLPAVGVDDGISVDRQLLVRIHGHQNDSWGKMPDAVLGFYCHLLLQVLRSKPSSASY